MERRPFGNTGLEVSPVGFGGYRISPDFPEHRHALAQALAAGINLIDTSGNYTDGGSETLVGQVLAREARAGSLGLDQVVVVSKVGYLQGQNFELSQRRKEEGRPFPELVPYEQGLEHCIHPDFIADQIARSLERLGLERLGAYLLHNPEYYLGWARKAGADLETAREEYYRRIGNAFAFLEELADEGLIAAYGISSNTFPTPADDFEHTSLSRVWELAQELGERHRFGVIQFPMNLLETEAVTLANQPGGQSLLELARELGLAVMINRPLNAMGPEGLFRLAQSPVEDAPLPQVIQEMLGDLTASERRFKQGMLGNLPLSDGVLERLEEYLTVAEVLSLRWRGIHGLEHWRGVEQYFISRVNAAAAHLASSLEGSTEGMRALDAHLTRLRRVFEALHAHFATQANEEAETILARVAAADPDWAEAPNLSQAAVRALRSTQGISAVLVGMRQPTYVDDVLAELARPVETSPRRESWAALARG